ncbi:hypothetical protein FRB99_002941, partial [Tulasnella sp. 403]
LPVAPKKKKGLSNPSPTCLASDSLNRILIVGMLDGSLHFFDFHTAELQKTLELPTSVVSITLQESSGLLAVRCDELIVRLVDIEAQRVVRELSGFTGRVLDLTFSPDSRWLITTSLDSTIRVFDIPTGRLIDGFITPSVATSVAFSPTGDFLATAHVDSVGVFLWANRAQYTEVSFKSLQESDIREAGMPSAQGLAEDATVEALTSMTVGNPADVYSTPSQLADNLMTLTLLPRSRWQTLLNIDAIQQRNKPKEPPKAPQPAPFFLPTLPGIDQRFDMTKASEENDTEAKGSRKKREVIQTDFLLKLAGEDEDGDYEDFFVYIKKILPAALDAEIRTMSGLQHLSLFVNALTRRLQHHRDFEAVQALLSVFFRIHGDAFIENDELKQPLETLLEVQKAESSRLLDLVSASLAMFFSRLSYDPEGETPDLTGKVALVTGGNSGIGYESVKHLAKHGAKVYLAARSEERATAAIQKLREEGALQKGSVEFLKVDLASLRDVRRAADELVKKEQHLHILINNAGLLAKLDRTLTDEGIVETLAVNHFGHFLLTTSLLPLLKSTSREDGSDVRIVNMASEAYKFPPAVNKIDSLDSLDVSKEATLPSSMQRY